MTLIEQLRTARRAMLADLLEKEAASNPAFRRLILPIGEAYYRITARLQRGIDEMDGLPTHGEIPPPNEGQAFQAAAELFGELFAVTAVVAALIWRSSRSAREVEMEVIEALKQRVEELSRERDRLDRHLEQLKEERKELLRLARLARSRGLGGTPNPK